MLHLVGDGLSNARIAERLYPLGPDGRDACVVVAHQADRRGRGQLTALTASITSCYDVGGVTAALDPVVSRMRESPVSPDDRWRARDSKEASHDRTSARNRGGSPSTSSSSSDSCPIYTGSMLTYMIDIGHRTGLLTAAAAGPAASSASARRPGRTPGALRARVARGDGHGRHRRLRPGRRYVHVAGRGARPRLTDGPRTSRRWRSSTRTSASTSTRSPAPFARVAVFPTPSSVPSSPT